MGGQFPYGTLTVNVLGSFLLGVFAVLIVETGSVSLEWRLMVTTGMLGAFTTFSTFSYESVSLLREGFYLAFAGNILGSVVFCLSAVTLGILVGHFLSFLVFVLS